MAFAQNFGYCLDQTGLSPYAFAQIIGVSNQGVLNWKKGVSIPYPKTQQKIANYFGITVEALMGGELPVLPPEAAKKAPAAKGEGISCYETELMRLWRCLSPEQQARELAFLREEALKSVAEKDS